MKKLKLILKWFLIFYAIMIYFAAIGSFSTISPLLSIILIVAPFYLLYKKNEYFGSEQFLRQKHKVKGVISEYNSIAEYADEISNNNQFISSDVKNQYSHLATSSNTSHHNYQRDRNVRTLNDPYVHTASLNIVRRASEQPIKYLCKYFDIEPTEENLRQLENLSDNIYKTERISENLKDRYDEIINDIDPPLFILLFFKRSLQKELLINIPDITVQYAVYVFEYVSAGGNSSEETRIVFDGETVDATIEYISEQINYQKSAKAQRSLMTEKFRNEIKERDDYTCQYCHVSIYDQDLLLLEVDHILPISKGGMSTYDNLQTLCWKCNRTKSNKIIA